MVKRTSFPPWQSTLQSSAPQPATASPQFDFSFTSSTQPEPPRITSDLPQPISHGAGDVGNIQQNSMTQEQTSPEFPFHSLRPSQIMDTLLAENPRIRAAQSAWEVSQHKTQPQKLPLATPSTEQATSAKGQMPVTSTPVPLPARHSSTPTASLKRPAEGGNQGPAKRPQKTTWQNDLGLYFGHKRPTAEIMEERRLEEVRRREAERRAENTTEPSPDSEGDVDDNSVILETNGRPYKKYKDPVTGELLPSHGCLIPDGYKNLDGTAFSWVCPLRECRKTYGDLKALGGHFNMCHNSLALNDNLDGTLSLVRRYKSTGKSSPAVIVSRNPLPADVPPVKPALPTLMNSDKPASQSPTPRMTQSEDDVPKNMALISYLHTYLDQRQRTPFYREDVAWMVSQPQRRKLPEKWLDQHHGGIVDKTHYAIAIAYLVGEEVTGAEACTKAPGSLGRLGGICIQLPSSMPTSARVAFSKVRTCISCKYVAWNGRQSNNCEWVRRLRPYGPAHLPESQTTGETSPDLSQDQLFQSVERQEVSGDTEARASVEDVQMIRRRGPGRAAKPAHIHVPVYDKNDISADAMVVSEAAAAGLRAGPGATGLEMEDWEFAPGRVEERGESWAFSGPYLTTQEPIQMTDETSFNVMHVRPGATIHLQKQADRLRCVSVAAGKIKVKKGSQECFIGPHGAFKVLPGETCVIENRFYIEAWVHCMSLDNFSLMD
ncbi:hypothetical protein N3K66_007081 [Trichothecium roseum]|uniref:Uncharacterized protein n=1 Tax=Trichothecium roseum TaxID=47278 RepID=A0ACC0UX73_9HYPO|nr:hypothetical protein N3K66_007081 [Trichothecium roseum]